MVAGEKLKDRLFLRVVERDSLLGDKVDEAVEKRIGVDTG